MVMFKQFKLKVRGHMSADSEHSIQNTETGVCDAEKLHLKCRIFFVRAQ